MPSGTPEPVVAALNKALAATLGDADVTPINDAPVASNSTITAAEESVNTPLGLAAPTDVDGNALTITVTDLDNLGAPIVGRTLSAVSSSPSRVTVTASAVTNASGQATFTLTFVSGGTATITITMTT